MKWKDPDSQGRIKSKDKNLKISLNIQGYGENRIPVFYKTQNLNYHFLTKRFMSLSGISRINNDM